MKKWNTPEVAELNITETANGWDVWWDEGVKTDGKSYFMFINVGDTKDEGNGGNGDTNTGELS